MASLRHHSKLIFARDMRNSKFTFHNVVLNKMEVVFDMLHFGMEHLISTKVGGTNVVEKKNKKSGT